MTFARLNICGILFCNCSYFCIILEFSYRNSSLSGILFTRTADICKKIAGLSQHKQSTVPQWYHNMLSSRAVVDNIIIRHCPGPQLLFSSECIPCIKLRESYLRMPNNFWFDGMQYSTVSIVHIEQLSCTALYSTISAHGHYLALFMYCRLTLREFRAAPRQNVIAMFFLKRFIFKTHWDSVQMGETGG